MAMETIVKEPIEHLADVSTPTVLVASTKPAALLPVAEAIRSALGHDHVASMVIVFEPDSDFAVRAAFRRRGRVADMVAAFERQGTCATGGSCEQVAVHAEQVIEVVDAQVAISVGLAMRAERRAYFLGHAWLVDAHERATISAQQATNTIVGVSARLHAQTQAVWLATQENARAVAKVAGSMTANPKIQVTAASAATGAVLVGAGGATVGVVSGSVVGAAVGFVPALFTFGLSIPICAFAGASVGLVSGAAVGSSAGFVGGGAVGYGVYTNKNGIRSFTSTFIQRMRRSTSNSVALVQEGAVSASWPRVLSLPQVEP